MVWLDYHKQYVERSTMLNVSYYYKNVGFIDRSASKISEWPISREQKTWVANLLKAGLFKRGYVTDIYEGDKQWLVVKST